MAEPIINSQSSAPTEPELRQNPHEPMGVLRKNLKPLLYLGVAGLVIAAAVFSSTGKKTPAQQAAAQHEPPQPMVQDNTDNNVQDLKNQLATEKQQSTQAGLTPAQASAMSAYSPTGQQTPCVPGQTCPQQQNGYGQAAGEPQLSPAQQEAQQLAIKERQLAYDSRFASNLVYAHQADAASPATTARQSTSNLVAARAAGDPSFATGGQTSAKRSAEVNIDSAVGQPYVIYEGTTLDTVLMNRLDGDAVGPVKVLVSNPVYSHDHQHVLIPDGTVVLGEAKKIGSAGFGQQRRMAVAFHRMIMPDGYSVDLDQFHGLDQIGAEGLKDKVNNHYLQIFGASIALGIVSGAAEIEQGGGTISTSGSQAFTSGTASSVSQSATTVLDRFIQIPPTITIREGHRVKVYFTQDMLLPAYENHTISQTF
ncbi:TrbI/VirB10 family protein [Telmatobacter bradus]|uniref:TrbI/VirB10 family protein n=1 Tax=Telmatobacter bradus TaxID=474953 RepID=UPI003B433FDA